MGCFSYLCKECNKPINSSSFTGEGVKLFLLQKGEVLEEMQGNYNSYGEVFDEEWTNEWENIVDLKFNGRDEDGIAAIHTDCWKGNIPTTQSESDENQGWGKEKKKVAKETYHKFYKMIDLESRKETDKRDVL